MGFYGKVINYLTKAFSKIKIGTNIIQSTDFDDTLEMQGDNWIKLSAQDKVIKYEHTNPLKPTATDKYGNAKLSIASKDISEGSTITISTPQFDEHGHVINHSKEVSIELNIEKEIQARKDADKKVAESVTAEKERAEAAEQALSERIGVQATNDKPGTGVYAYVDSVKDSILGSSDLDETFDTLQEIAAWIEESGANATKLTDAIAEETKNRKAEDEKINEKLAELTLADTALADKDDALGKEIIDLQKSFSDYENEINNIKNLYETKIEAQKKLNEAKQYTDNQISLLSVPDNSTSNQYVSAISQTDGRIVPILRDLPFDFADVVRFEYNEDTGDLSFPDYFKVYSI